MTFIRRLMEIKEKQLRQGKEQFVNDEIRNMLLRQILKVLKGGKDGKRKISRKDKVPNRFGRG